MTSSAVQQSQRSHKPASVGAQWLNLSQPSIASPTAEGSGLVCRRCAAFSCWKMAEASTGFNSQLDVCQTSSLRDLDRPASRMDFSHYFVFS